MPVESKFHEAGAWVKKHPYATAGAVFIGGAILIYLYYSSGAAPPASTGATADQSYLQAQLVSEAQQAQYGAALGAQQAQTQAVATQVQGAVAIDQNRNAAAVTIAGLQAGVLGKQIGAGQTVSLAQIGAAQTVSLADIAKQVTINSQNTDAAVNISAINSAAASDLASKSLIADWIPFAAQLSAQNRATFGTGGSEVYFNPQTGSVQSGQTSLTPTVLASQGFSPAEIAAVFKNL